MVRKHSQRELHSVSDRQVTLHEDEGRHIASQPAKTWGFPSQFIQINQGVNGHTTRAPPGAPQGRRLGYHTPEQVSNPEPPDSRPCVLTTTLLGTSLVAVQTACARSRRTDPCSKRPHHCRDMVRKHSQRELHSVSDRQQKGDPA